MPLADSLKSKKLTFFGTIRKNKKEILKELVQNINRPVGSSMFAFQEDRTIVSYYILKKKRFVLLYNAFRRCCK